MARRMDVELTSDRGDGTWTWRAAGARQPRGVIDAAVLGGQPHVGDVIRVEAEIELDGITITAVLPQRTSSPRKGLIEIAATGRPEPGGVTTSLLPRIERKVTRPGGDRRPRDDDRRPVRSGDRRTDRRPGETRSDDRRSPPARQPERPEGADERPGSATEAAAAPRQAAAAPRQAGGPTGAEARRRSSGEGAPRGGPAREGRSMPEGAAERARRSRPPRLSPGTAHRDALLDTLPVEQRPIAEQLAIGGLPAVRRALAEERAAAAEQGLPAASGDAIVALAEQLLPGVREARWLDHAEAAERILGEISLRDLRSAVAGAAPRDERGRELLRRLREALEARVNRLREAWERDMIHALEEGRVLQALRLSTRPPEPNTRFPAALVNRLAEATGAAMTTTTSAERWLALLEAASLSPVGRLVRPAGVPDDPALKRAAAQAAGRIPALAPLLGLSMPPPPRPAGAPAAGRRSFGVPALGRRGPVRPARPAGGAAGPRTEDAPAPAAADAPESSAALEGSSAEAVGPRWSSAVLAEPAGDEQAVSGAAPLAPAPEAGAADRHDAGGAAADEPAETEVPVR